MGEERENEKKRRRKKVVVGMVVGLQSLSSHSHIHTDLFYLLILYAGIEEEK